MATSPSNRGVLIPLPVPWQLGRSDSLLDVSYNENGNLSVVVNASVLPLAATSSLIRQRIQVVFLQPNEFHFGLGFDEDDFIELDEYLSNLAEFGRSDEEDRQIIANWFASGLCPNPFAYEVEKSNYLSERRLDQGNHREFLLIGDDASMRIVARDFQWKIQ